MDVNIVSTTEIQRNFKRVLDRMKASSEPLVVVRDSQPEAVMLQYSEFKRLSELEREVLKEKMEKILKRMAKHNRNISDKELNADIAAARRATRSS